VIDNICIILLSSNDSPPVVLGHGERPILDMYRSVVNNKYDIENHKNIKTRNDKTSKSPYRMKIADTFSPKRRKQSDDNFYMVHGSNGCVGNCNFCSVNSFLDTFQRFFQKRSNFGTLAGNLNIAHFPLF
jgi:radical SAM superfamily enzyme YgiQ (UPF0313 family)